MALNPQERIAVLATVFETLRLARTQLRPYVVLTLAFSLPFVAAGAAGLFDSLDAFGSQYRSGGESAGLAGFPLGEFLLAQLFGFVTLSGFGIFWYRYLLLGAGRALKLGIAELNGMVWRFVGYGVLVTFVGLTIFVMATLLGCVLGGFVARLLGAGGTVLSYMIQGVFVMLAYVWPITFAARTALIFPAIAIGRPIALSDAWGATRHTGGSLAWTLVIVGVPLLALSWVVHYGAFSAIGIDPLSRSAVSADGYWWLDLLLSPVGNLAIAAMLGVLAVAHRDLLDRPRQPEMAPGASLAH